MILKWKYIEHSKHVIGLSCKCGVVYHKSAYKFDKNLYGKDEETDKLSIMAEARVSEKEFPINLKFCPQCGKKVVFEQQINISKTEYDRLKEAADGTNR